LVQGSDNIAWEYRRSSVNTLKLINLKQPKISIRTRRIAAATCLAFFAGCAQIAAMSESVRRIAALFRCDLSLA
jgi:hypothetical protein